MSEAPLVSIVIPTYNHGHLIGRCLRSVAEQTFENWEAVIVNNYSNDSTIEVVREFNDSRIHLINFHNNGVIAASRNEGIRCSRGKYIAFLDSDDWWYRDKLELVMKRFGGSDLVYHDVDIYTPNGKKIRGAKGKRLKRPVYVDLLKNGNAVPASSVVANKDIIIKVGGLNESKHLVATEDYDLWLRIARVTENFTYIPRSLGVYWIGGASTTEISEIGVSRMESVFAEHLPLLNEDDRIQAETIKSYQIGRIKHKMGLYNDSLKFYRVAIRTKSIELKLKTIYFILYLWLTRALTKK